MKRFLGKESTSSPKKLNVNEMFSNFTSDTNFFSNMGTSFTGSTAHNAGMTENVIIIGFRFMNLGSKVVGIYNNLMFNFNSLRYKLENINKVVTNISEGGNNTPVRESCILYNTRKK